MPKNYQNNYVYVFATNAFLRILIFSNHPSPFTHWGKSLSEGAFCFHTHTFLQDISIDISLLYKYLIAKMMDENMNACLKKMTLLWTRIKKNL